ncbi:RNA polymerase sigma factor [Humisphaera borealis]|uniref:Sigma-70 family RNA polymerase sigma factor n=1 Tax=Humisphaera borealis TaxID=2807512 RepID=A0A7M2WQM0_9BACT|nr:sigma-70 family RNA polymerase sigma factor [Humisphaera borealis]QOV87713.1 sigma-70 family RNA polymerase sigma factor [Humisphaera borealis]
MTRVNPAMIADWFDAHGRALVLYARQLLPERPVQADDLVQDLFVKLLALAADCNGSPVPPNPAAWLHKCLRNACLDERRGRVRRQRREQSAATDRPVWFEPRPEDLIDARLAQCAMESLPELARQVVTLRIWSGLTLAEVADVTGMGVSTVHDHYRKALSAMRSMIETQAAELRSRHDVSNPP